MNDLHAVTALTVDGVTRRTRLACEQSRQSGPRVRADQQDIEGLDREIGFCSPATLIFVILSKRQLA